MTTPVRTGDIYRASAPDQHSALVLVTGFDSTTRTASVTLLSPDTLFATNLDLLVHPTETGLGYDLLIESDIFGYLWTHQLDQSLGQVSRDTLAALAALRNQDAVGRPPAGPPVKGRSDPRWDFKIRELARLRVITADCTRALVGA